jgi:hypothetical protein
MAKAIEFADVDHGLKVAAPQNPSSVSFVTGSLTTNRAFL